MSLPSILFDTDNIPRETGIQPECFPDLNLDQLVDAIAARKEEYNLRPFFQAPPHNLETVRYRQQVMRDLEKPALAACVQEFSDRMVLVRRHIGMLDKLGFPLHRQGWILATALDYCSAVTDLARGLGGLELRSPGFESFRAYVNEYVASVAFQALGAEARQVHASLSAISYSIVVDVGAVKVRKYEGEPDYTTEVVQSFSKFKEGASKSYLVDLYEGPGMNHVEAQILGLVARLYPEEFAVLDRFCQDHTSFVDEIILTFDREVQFYLAYLALMEDIQSLGLVFCYPEVSASREVFSREGFDLALASTRLHSGGPVICNDFELTDEERVIVVSGPNQGGKTTFARTFGQLHYLGSLGLPVPGREARLLFCDQVLTHFERMEDISNGSGKLEDDLRRIHDLLARATPDSVLVLNEIFASTTLQDAAFLSRRIMDQVMELGALCVWVTFLEELSKVAAQTISMVSTVEPGNPAVRTFKIVRQPADGMAYALSIAQKHRLTYEDIKERIAA